MANILLKLVVLSFLVVCCVGFPRPSRIFGNLLSKESWMQKHHYLGSEYVKAPPKMFQKTKFTFTFPRPEDKSPNKEFIIHAIEQIDHTKHGAQPKFVKGNIGSNEVTMAVTAPRGEQINSVFHFYGQEVPLETQAIPVTEDQTEEQLIFY